MATSPVVAREPELAALSGALGRALGGQGQVRFVVGEAGSGKSSVVQAFLHEAQAGVPDLLCAVGQCDARTGAGDAYLPLREVLGVLTGTAAAASRALGDSKTSAQRLFEVSGKAIAEFGPDLVGLLVPGADLVFKIGTFATQAVWAEKLRRQAEREGPRQGVTQDQIFEQYTNVLLAMAREQPLLIVLDDLQWADAASLALLFRLGRRLEGSRILLIGTYRPDEVALGRGGERHPLEGAVNELQRYGGDITLDLDAARQRSGRAFVDALLDQEPNALDEDFRHALHAHTSGHPLFVAELLRAMQERGDLLVDAQGRWTPGAHLDWDTLPARIEAVIAERVARLSADLREALAVGSVEGEQFTAEVVARVRSVEARGLVRQLSGALDRQHQLVSALGLERAGTQRLARYSFRHGLFQRHLYAQLDAVERAYLHQDVGEALEALYGDGADAIAVPLAHHFLAAGDEPRARRYLRVAGQDAARRYAHDLALEYLTRALALIPADEGAERFGALLARQEVYSVLGRRAEERADLTALETLAAGLDDAHRARVALAQAGYANSTADLDAAAQAAQHAEALASAAGDQILLARALHLRGVAVNRQGDRATEAQTLLERALATARSVGSRRHEGRALLALGSLEDNSGQLDAADASYRAALDLFVALGDVQSEVNALNNLGSVARKRGDLDEAAALSARALGKARSIGDRRGEVYLLIGLGAQASARAEFAASQQSFEDALAVAEAIADARGCLLAHEGAGLSALRLGRYAAARVHLDAALAAARTLGDRVSESYELNNVAMVEHATGRYAAARAGYEASLELKRARNNRWAEGYTLAYVGLLEHHQGNHAAAEATSAHALDIARGLGALAEVASALTVRGHALAALGRADEASAAYREALELRRALRQPHLACEPLAGLARVALSAGGLASAREHVQDILGVLDAGGTLDSADEPLRVWLTCIRVLQAAGEPRAGLLLVGAHHRLQRLAAALPDDEARQDLWALPHHREVLDLWTTQER
ncbi:tetratricopeptide (TPR) repeat protein [Deinococcus metalli]|uniref:Tetratricopeptide (TPR) repeat protein n=1 Tax=Deinococcus metalli TaxID=1141878 RepID=A0A7W8NRC7_9DEIO|nr:tetratricopeptide repeat protein [Deinococcus metalli]MBB5377765.1 tetratricopeptide (TPR) repeat protein [Deinococcus metalli]GHF53183.1 hypothetical protein GCM10017781_31940 [Deinococcus metalli]